jgi:hypothetical protein
MHAAQPLDGIDELEHFLRLIDFQIEVGGDEVGQTARIVEARDDCNEILR